MSFDEVLEFPLFHLYISEELSMVESEESIETHCSAVLSIISLVIISECPIIDAYNSSCSFSLLFHSLRPCQSYCFVVYGAWAAIVDFHRCDWESRLQQFS